MRRYESYKDSGVDWLGEIPTHWECLPLRSIFKFRNEKNDPIKTDNILSLSIANGVTEYSDENRGGNKRKDDLSSYKLAYPNDIVINSMNVIVGAVGVSKYFGAISPVYYALSLYNQRANLSYYENIFKNENFQRGLLQFGKGILIKFGENGKMNTIRMKISQDDFKKLYFPIPPLDEQQKIAQFLDDKTAKIDQAVDLAEKQIALLKEHKQILIQNAVTRGLNPDVPLKDSGVEWIGQVPEHWEILSIKRLSQVKRGASPRPIDNPKYFDDDGEYAWVRISDVTASNMYLLETTQKLSNLGKSYSVPLMPGSLFLSIAGSVGKPIITKIKVCIHDGFVYFPEYKQNTKFLYYIFYSEQPYIGLGKMGTQLNLNTDTVGAIKIPIPPLCEQQQIADYLDAQTAKIDQAIALKTAHIEKLKEYKSVLINDAVTGKVRVSV